MWWKGKFMMQWFYNWLDRKISNSRQNQLSVEKDVVVSTRTIDSSGMNFTVYRANGGHIIETRKYDRKRDSNDHSLHIITDDKDLGEEIGKIITFENLRS
jgi:hypothetical protein